MASRMICLHILMSATLLLACLQGGYGVDITLNFIKEPEDVIAKRNQPVLLDCSSSSTPDHGVVNVTWYHKGIILLSDGRRQILNNGSLHIRKVRFKKHSGSGSGSTGSNAPATTNVNDEANGDDIGPYYCSITNRIGTLVSRQAHIYVASMAKKFTIEPEPAVVEEGDVIRFSCQIQAFPVPKYSWQKELNTSENSDSWIRIPQVDSRFTVLAGGVLQISRVQSSDAGNYRCVGHSSEHSLASNKALLQVIPASNVYRAPTFLTKESTVTVKAGETAILECLVSSYPPTDIVWSRRGDIPIKSNSESTYGTGNLVLTSVTLEDDGAYICTSWSKETDELESSSIAQNVYLHVQKLPEFIKKPQSLSGPLGRTVRLECETQGVPTPTITWLKDGRSVDISGRLNLRNNELVFSQTITADAGLYQCKAENSLGQRLASVRLQFVPRPDQPSTPNHLVATTRSNTSIELSWLPAASPPHLPIRAYTIHYSLTAGGHESTTVVVNTSSVIDKLIPYTNYTFYVRAWTARSPSELSESVTGMTGEDVPLLAPAVVLNSNLTSLHITWDELPPSVARGIIIQHKIQWRKKDHGSYNVLEVSGKKREYTVSGLRPGNKYDVRVLAATKMGYPVLPNEKWPWVTHAMPDFVVPHVPLPPILLLTVVNFSTVKVGWKMPEDNQFEAKGFELRYGKQNQNPTKSFSLPNNVSHYLITDLESNSLYEVRINGFNENGSGTESVGVIATPQENSQADGNVPNNWYVVEPPSELEAIATSSRSIRLMWKPPLTNKNISHYMVRCNPVHNTSDFNTSVVRYFKSDKPEVNLTDLMPYTQYEFSVRSHDQEDKPGPYSNKVECKTLEDVPTAPMLLRWFIYDPHTIRVTWQPPKYPNGVIISYDILYNVANGPHITYEQWSKVTEQGSESTSLVNGLDSNTIYYLCIRAETRAGAGPPTETITLKIPKLSDNRNNSKDTGGEFPEYHDSKIGIIVGVSIGMCCMIVCALIIIFRNRCLPSPAPIERRGLHNQTWGNGYAHHNNNGNGHIQREYRISSSESHEMDSVTPMLTNIPESTSPHIDTKGGYIAVMPYVNGNANHNKETESPCINGQESHSILINITPNPQFEINGDVKCKVDKHKNNSKTCNGDSLSSSATLLEKCVENAPSSSEVNQAVGAFKQHSPSGSRSLGSQEVNGGVVQAEQNINDHSHRQHPPRPYSEHSTSSNHSSNSGSSRHNQNHHNQSSKQSKRNSAPPSSKSCGSGCKNNNNNTSPTNISSISPSSSSSNSASESLLPTSSSSSTVVIIPTVSTKNGSGGHHTSTGKDGGRRWRRPLSHTAISATPSKVTGLSGSNGSCNSMGSSSISRTNEVGENGKRLNGSSGGVNGINHDNVECETSEKMLTTNSSFPSSIFLNSNPPLPRSISPTSHLLCAATNTNSHKLVVQT